MKKKQSNQTRPVLDLISQSKENRAKFLAPYKEKYLDAKKRLHEIKFLKYRGVLTEKQVREQDRDLRRVEQEISKIISYLIKLEPSHLSEPWILQQIIDWLREYKCRDYIKEVFVNRTDRDQMTESKYRNMAYDLFLYERIEKIKSDVLKRTKKKLPNEKAFEKFVYDQVEEPNPMFPMPLRAYGNSMRKFINRIGKIYYRHQKRLKNQSALPFPYYGRDFDER
jgi:hypothetical protein